ncbi:Gamma-interferon-responsive lysosomal thiol protein [Amphibalanus amphitrite]|uniref:Gamma-interferon-responsive lysosomal thiol protein n=1 Tax=Amphibalanus amphitrite TaxID=1232801 RepID=A0A6A4W1K2_AMPAM|nr:Gamma-interferon-responsive lysosomal thiol protein [Amphibalanus amphitrite]
MSIVVWSLLLTAVAAAAADPTPPLQVVLYYESLCPDCQAFVSGSFAEAVARRARDPERHTGALGVRHRPRRTAPAAGRFSVSTAQAECRGNKLHACGVYLAPSPAVSVDFSICLESQMAGEQCAQQTGLDWLSLTDCQLRRDTDQLMIPYRDMTDAARPEIVEVPTVSVDGRQEHQGQMLDDFLGYVCSVWQGDTPDGCPPAR